LGNFQTWLDKRNSTGIEIIELFLSSHIKCNKQ